MLMDNIMINYTCDIWPNYMLDFTMLFRFGPMVAFPSLALVSPLDQRPTKNLGSTFCIKYVHFVMNISVCG